MDNEKLIIEELKRLSEEVAKQTKEKKEEDSPLMIKRKTMKSHEVKRWEKDFNSCNPMDENDKAVMKSLEQTLPKGGIVTSQRGKKLEDLTIIELEYWSIRNEEDVRRWVINIPASIVLAHKLYKIWKEEGDSDGDIERAFKEEEIETNRFPNAEAKGLI